MNHHANISAKIVPIKFVVFCVLSVLCGCGRYADESRNEDGPAFNDQRRTQETLGTEVGTARLYPQNSEHPHQAGLLGGAITSFAADRYHAEAVIEDDGTLYVYVLGADETELYSVDRQSVTAYLRKQENDRSTAIVLDSAPLDTDSPAMTTRFSGTIPNALLDGALYVAIPGLQVEDQRYMLRFAIVPAESVPEDSPSMPVPASEVEAEELYLTSGGLYTEADIIANGSVTAGQKYRNFRPNHDPNPKPGDRICPITKTKANEECNWIIGGKVYYFCCPPCIDEFLETAKLRPDEISSLG